MIYIIDNGGEYSNHILYFLESELRPDQLMFIFKSMKKAWDNYVNGNGFDPGSESCYGNKYKIIGVAQHINWWENGTTSLENIFNPYQEEAKSILQNIINEANKLKDPLKHE